MRKQYLKFILILRKYKSIAKLVQKKKIKRNVCLKIEIKKFLYQKPVRLSLLLLPPVTFNPSKSLLNAKSKQNGLYNCILQIARLYISEKIFFSRTIVKYIQLNMWCCMHARQSDRAILLNTFTTVFF